MHGANSKSIAQHAASEQIHCSPLCVTNDVRVFLQGDMRIAVTHLTLRHGW